MARVMVLGAYGLIGSACTRALLADGHAVVGVGRNPDAARILPEQVSFLKRDLADLTFADWERDLDGFDAVVNCAGALQDGARDRLDSIHAKMPALLARAAAQAGVRLVQISAAGVCADAPTAFMQTKAQGDAEIASSAADWVILKPVLVLSTAAYGGTALLRASAAFPWIQLRVLAGAQVQTVHVDDVARAVVMAVRGDLPSGLTADLTESERHEFSDLQARLRGWLGFPPWRGAVRIPDFLLNAVGNCADALGWLGWRSPLRSTALVSLRVGVTGDAATWPGPPCRSLEQSLADMPATTQERWFARLYLVLPLAIGLLSLFWILSGAIGLIRADAAAQVLTERGFAPMLAMGSVLTGSAVDIALGAGLLIRRYARRAALGTIAVSLVYMAGAAVWAPDLWLDPLGPMVKVLPGVVLSAIVAMLIEAR